MFPLKVPGEDLFQVSHLASGGSLAYGSVTPVFIMCFPYLSPNFPFCKDMSYIGLGATLFQYHLILTTNYNFNDLIPSKVTF